VLVAMLDLEKEGKTSRQTQTLVGGVTVPAGCQTEMDWSVDGIWFLLPEVQD